MPLPPLVNYSLLNFLSMKPRLARFLISYRIAAKTYSITLPGLSASHIWRSWDRPGSTLLDVCECDHHGLPEQ
jgi:hypothetical protein